MRHGPGWLVLALLSFSACAGDDEPEVAQGDASDPATGAPGDSDAGASADAAEGGNADAAGPSVSGPEPVIPKPSMACPSFQSGSTSVMGMNVDIYAGPKSTGAKAPLVFYWHGTRSNGQEPNRTIPAAVRDDIMAQGGILVAPNDIETAREGMDVTILLSVWYTPGDLNLADLIAACAVENHNIDPRRIYSTGCSAGGLMTGVMAFHRSSYVAAAVPNSGGLVSNSFAQLQDPTHVPAVMTMHGARGQGNDMVIVEFADTSRTLDETLASQGGFVVNCDHGGGHCGASPELQMAAWQFMKDHPFGVSPEPYADGLPASFPSYCQIFKP
jgi:acetyl esterase/lipase